MLRKLTVKKKRIHSSLLWFFIIPITLETCSSIWFQEHETIAMVITLISYEKYSVRVPLLHQLTSNTLETFSYIRYDIAVVIIRGGSIN